MPYYPSKKRSWKSGKGKGNGGPPKKKSLTATVSALAKIVKKDHKLIKNSIDYTDFLFPESIAIVSYRTWNYNSLIQPVNWSFTCRRSNVVSTTPETQLKEVHVSICCNHGTSNYETAWFVAVVRAKKDWTPDTANPSTLLRTNIDWSDMGAGNAPVLNADKFVILKQWSVTTNYFSQGEPSQSTKRLNWKFRMNQTLRASPQTSSNADQNWLTSTETDYETSDRLYILHYANTPSNASWGVLYNPSITVGVRFTTCTM